MRLCTVVCAELYFGAQKSKQVSSNLAQLERFLESFAILPFDRQAAFAYGRIRAQLTARGTPIGANDLLIAATALAHDLSDA